METRDLIQKVRDDGVQFISLQFTDILGQIKSVTITQARLHKALDEGVWFDGSSIEGFARISEADMFLVPDPITYQVLPWSHPDRLRARLICDVYSADGKPFVGDPRSVLKRVLERVSKKGLVYNCGPELEFFLFRPNNEAAILPVPHDVGGYFDFSPRDKAQVVRSDIVKALDVMGMEVEASHHEVASGQHEIDFAYADSLTAADNAVTFKYTVKAIAAIHDLSATFMPKPVFGENGSGMHVHQSMADAQSGENLFHDPNGRFSLSTLAEQFVAGQLKHARALTAVVAPTVNSYKRLVPGYEAPVYVCWAQINRSALIRVPRSAQFAKDAARLELRCPDPSCNPYLAFAAMLAAGLDGIDQQLTPPDPVIDDVYLLSESELNQQNIALLPGTLGESIDEMGNDQVIWDALGDHVSNVFIRAKQAEWDEYRIQVSTWERERYLESA
ncbi:MAG: type I glutamate--ammonia ligase [Chloroflexota bacterium]